MTKRPSQISIDAAFPHKKRVLNAIELHMEELAKAYTMLADESLQGTSSAATGELLMNTDLPYEASTEATRKFKPEIWAARIISGLSVSFLVIDGLMKVVEAPPAVAGTVQAGYPESVVFGIGLLLLICTLLYCIPRTSTLGAVLLTGYLGGAVATQVRVGNPLFSHVLFPVYFGAMVWAGLLLRDHQLRESFLKRKKST